MKPSHRRKRAASPLRAATHWAYYSNGAAIYLAIILLVMAKRRGWRARWWQRRSRAGQRH